MSASSKDMDTLGKVKRLLKGGAGTGTTLMRALCSRVEETGDLKDLGIIMGWAYARGIIHGEEL